MDKKYDEIKIRYLSLVNNYISKTKFNNIESEIVVLDLQNNGDILALVDGVKKTSLFQEIRFLKSLFHFSKKLNSLLEIKFSSIAVSINSS